MFPRGPQTAAKTTLIAGLGAAAAAGCVDVALHGSGLDPWAAAGTVALWVVLALPVAGAASAALALVTRNSDPRAAGAAPPRLPRWGLWSLVLAPLLAAALAASRYVPPQLPARANGAPGDVEAPNVVVIVLDTLRADHIGALGNAGGLTPVLDAFAQTATTFERCFAPASWTVPSHASLFTGLFPASHGASFAHQRQLADRFPTLAEGLHQAGYRTAAFVSNPHLARANLDQGFELYREVTEPFATLLIRKPLAALGGPARWIDEGAAQSALDVERFLARRAQEEAPAPLLLFINLLEAHWRHLPPASERRQAVTTAGYLPATIASARFYGPLAMARGELAPSDLTAVRALYAAEVRYQDALLGRLLAAIDRSLDPQRTLLIVTADHGENLGEGGRFDHVFALNDHLIRVPLFVRQPDHFPPGTRRSDLCQLLDVPATVREVVGPRGEAIPVGAGHSLTGPVPRGYVYAEGDPYLDHLDRMRQASADPERLARLAQPLRAVRDERFKLVWRASAPAALYDLTADPDELRDVAAAHPERARELALALERWRAAQPAYVPEPAPPREPLDRASRARLEALGYAQ